MDNTKKLAVHFNQRKIHFSPLPALCRNQRQPLRVFANQPGVRKIETVFLQIGLSFCLIPFVHHLIVHTFNRLAASPYNEQAS